MAPEPQCDSKHIIQTVGTFWEAAVQGVSSIVKAAISNHSEGCCHTILQDSMVCDILFRSLIRVKLFLA